MATINHEWRAASTADGGTALSTTTARVLFPLGTTRVKIHARNLSTAKAAQVAPMPWITVLHTDDDLSTVTDASDAMQDGAAGTLLTLSSMDTLANGDFVLVGSHVPLRGLQVDVGSVNGTSSIMTVKYWNGSAWTDISDTDGTASGGATLAQDAAITWTVPTAHVKERMRGMGLAPGAGVPFTYDPLFWYRIEVSVALDSAVTVLGMLGLPRYTTYAELAANENLEQGTKTSLGGHSGVEGKTAAGTANLIVNVFSSGDGFDG